MGRPPTNRRLDDRQRGLAAEHVEFALKLATPFIVQRPRLATAIESAAMLGLCQAAARFDPSQGVKFTSRAWPSIRGRIRDAIAAEDAITTGDDIPEVAGHARPGDGPESREAAAALLRRLPRPLRRVAALVGLRELNHAQAARRLGVTPPTVFRYLKRCRRHLKGE